MRFHHKLLKTRTLSWAIALVVLIAISGCTVRSSDTGSYYKDTISVTGFGEASGKPDIAMIQLGVSTISDQVGEAIEDSNQVMDSLTKALLGAGIAEEDLQTTNFNVWPEDKYDPLTGQNTGERVYHVDNTLLVKVRTIDQAPSIIELALEQGANNIYGLTYDIDDTTSLEAEARTKALADARVRAEQLATEIGVTLGDPINVSESYGSSTIYSAGYERAVGLGGGGVPISAGQLTINLQVNVSYAFVR